MKKMNKKDMAMKKFMLLMAVLTTTAMGVVGQVPDTVYQRGENYFYMEWYDELDEFNRYDSVYTHMFCLEKAGNYYSSYDPAIRYVGKSYYTDSPIRVKGLACMVAKDSVSRCRYPYEIYDSLERLPEYMYLFELNKALSLYPIEDTTVHLKLLDSVRWDTATPKVFKLKRFIDTSYGYMYCWLYEAMFDEPLTLDGNFLIVGTYRSNALTGAPDWPHHFQCVPTNYVGVRGRSRLNNSSTYNYIDFTGSFDGWWLPGMRGLHGAFNAIMTGERLIQLHSGSDSMGTVLGEGFFPDSSTQYIEALPLEHFRFVSWNDGDTANPRAVLLTQDTSFTAYFRAAEQYRLDLESNDVEHGSVYGAGIYEEGDTVKIQAAAWRGYRFAHWSDGDTANPRWVVMTQDTLFVGVFVPQEGIGEVADGGGLRLVPNPADGYVVVSCDEAVEGVLVVADVAGKTVGRYSMSGTILKISTQGLADGVYYVTLNTAQGSATRKLVVERR